MDPVQQTPDATPSVADSLQNSSSFFARSAAAAYASESWDLFYLHLATAVEQLLKAVLARANPAFIADPRASFDSLLHLTGMGDRATAPEFIFAVRTITPSEALERVGRIVDDYRQPNSGVVHLLATRNGVVHAGHRAKAAGEAVLGDVASYVTPLLKSLEVEPDEYWGDYGEMVADHAQRRLSASEAAYGRKLQAARDRYAQRTASMDDSSRAAYIAALLPPPPEPPFEYASAPCPACGNPGLLTGSPQPDWEADWDVEGGEAYVSGAYVASIRVDPDGFECGACGLRLDRSMVDLAGIGSVTLRDDDFDVSEASSYFERQAAYESWDDD